MLKNMHKQEYWAKHPLIEGRFKKKKAKKLHITFH